MAIELVTYADLKALLNLDKTLITDYPALNLLRDSVISAIETYTGRLLESKERTEVGYLTSSAMIALPAIPITEVDTLTIEGVVSEEYEITAYGLILTGTFDSNDIFSVVYTGGITTVPDALKRAALLQIAYEFQNKDHIGAESVTTDGGTVNRPALGLLKEVRRLLDSYKHPLRW